MPMSEIDRLARDLRNEMFELKSAYEMELSFQKIAESNDKMRELWSEYVMVMGDKLLTVQSKLPSKDEYYLQRDKLALVSEASNEWSTSLFHCAICGGDVQRKEDYLLTSYPPRFLYRCDKCGWQDSHV